MSTPHSMRYNISGHVPLKFLTSSSLISVHCTSTTPSVVTPLPPLPSFSAGDVDINKRKTLKIVSTQQQRIIIIQMKMSLTSTVHVLQRSQCTVSVQLSFLHSLTFSVFPHSMQYTWAMLICSMVRNPPVSRSSLTLGRVLTFIPMLKTSRVL